ncbi:50S ribosomal protein L9 [Frankliniella fusca]|uniref:50S ribosomal protein L9 n=1 Tax=Frankliniella fusca TaxID=407009 RepID=A0AAE1HE33_9NEOP|nr:50S ribosomal protein L9 [Frankliniella fusca]
MGEPLADQIVMTPKCKTANSTTLIIERKSKSAVNGDGSVHVAGGDHKGIVINKTAQSDLNADVPAQLSLEFRVFLVSAQTGKHTQESRNLQFWFVASLPDWQQPHVAQEFFKELVSPQEFPRDYVGFIKKLMKLMQHRYPSIRRLEIELRQLESVAPPTRPLSADESILGQKVELTEEKVLELIESSYPNPITIQDISNTYGWEVEQVASCIEQLQSKGLVKSLEHGAFTRVGQADSEIQIVKQMPTMASAKQPTIAVITAQYCEKIAVDAMLENKETFVRYTTVGLPAVQLPDGTYYKPTRFGESNVYTLGNIGAHRIVSTKLPSVGHTREAMTAAGNTTTRLLGKSMLPLFFSPPPPPHPPSFFPFFFTPTTFGTFQKVDYVFLVGVGGGVPHYTDYSKHVRLGDVVVSHPNSNQKKTYVYTYCGYIRCGEGEGDFEFDTKEYCPNSLVLQDIAAQLKSQEEKSFPWMQYLNEALKGITSNELEQDFARPDANSDKLFMSIGERDVIEVAHPSPAEGAARRQEGCPRIHLGPIASGRKVAREDMLRQIFSAKYGALAYDCEFDAVIESVQGNCRDNFAVLRGIADYKDGARRSEWQPYAALAAASVMKAMICGLDAPSD